MKFTLDVIAAKRFALLKKIVSSARVPETGALRLDIQAINEQLLDAFKMKGVVTKYSPITPRMMEAFWKEGGGEVYGLDCGVCLSDTPRC